MEIEHITPKQSIEEIGEAIIQWLCSNPNGIEFQGFKNRISSSVSIIKLPDGQTIYNRYFHQAIWELLRQGLVYFDESWSNPVFWKLRLTEKGETAGQTGDYNPYGFERYISVLQQSVPAISEVVKRYAYEALISFRNECYLATAVMLGVASETAFFEMLSALENWLKDDYKEEFQRKLKNKRQYNEKFELFRQTIGQNKNQIDQSLCENMDLWFNAVLDTFRTYRNDAGHALGNTISRDDADMILRMFPNYIKRLYGFKAFFDANTQIV